MVGLVAYVVPPARNGYLQESRRPRTRLDDGDLEAERFEQRSDLVACQLQPQHRANARGTELHGRN